MFECMLWASMLKWAVLGCATMDLGRQKKQQQQGYSSVVVGCSAPMDFIEW
jgi:hypothetical protein